MAGGVISGFFRRARAGQPLRALADVQNLNRVANILNDITGEGCWIEKPLNGDPWIVHISDDTSGEEPATRRKVIDCEVSAKNSVKYNSSTGNIEPKDVEIYVNGIAAEEYGGWGDWRATPGVKWLYVWQYFGWNQKDADGQFVGNPRYMWDTNFGAGIGNSSAEVARFPYCRVEAGATQNDPPVIIRLLEGTVHVWCHRGDSQSRTFPYTTYFAAYANAKKPTSCTTDTTGDNLPLKVRNINAAADGYYNAYPNGRYHIVTSQGVDEVEWYTPSEPEQTKNDSKLLLLRYIYPQNNIPHGLPYWSTVNQFLTASTSWTHDYIVDVIEEDNSWLIATFSPWAWQVWSEKPGPYQPVLESDSVEGVEIIAAVMDRQGHWHSILDIVVSGEEYDVALDDYEDLCDRVDSVEALVQGCVDTGDGAEDIADDAAQTISNFTDFSQNVDMVDYESGNIDAHANGLATDFSDLDARITALEQRNA